MKKFICFMEKALFLIGFDFHGRFDGFPEKLKALMILRCFNFGLMVLSFIQAITYCFKSDWNDKQIVDTIVHGILFYTAFSRIHVLMKHLPSIRNMIFRINQVYKIELNGDFHLKGTNFMELMAKTGIRNVTFLSSLPILQLISGAVKMIIFWSKGEKPKHLFRYGLYFPFDPYDHLPWTYIYVAHVGWLSIFSSLIFDQMVVLCPTSYLAVCFEKLAEDFQEIIEKSKSSTQLMTRKKLRKCVDIHNQLIGFCNEINSFFQILILQISMLGPVIMAVLGYRAVVSKNSSNS